jgi:hypothetical protein
VQADRFTGTAYRAANWVCVGQTKGRTRQDRPDGTCHQAAIKDVYLYPLDRGFRQHLQGKPTKIRYNLAAMSANFIKRLRN